MYVEISINIARWTFGESGTSQMALLASRLSLYGLYCTGRADRFTADRFLTNKYQGSKSAQRDIVHGRSNRLDEKLHECGTLITCSHLACVGYCRLGISLFKHWSFWC